MKIIIDIPNEDFEIMKHNIAVGNPLCPLSQEKMVAIVAKGTPLPKEHGRLIDAKDAYKKFYNRSMAKIGKEVLDETPTIIEADKVESEK